MNLPQRHVILNTEDDLNWDVIEISKVNNKIIKNLIENLKQDISESFFISFESLIKISRKKNIKPILESFIKRMVNDDWHRDLFQFILKYMNYKEIRHPLIFQLYNPDFIKRARAILQAEHAKTLKYSRLILPLMDDPDDSVRWASLNYFINLNHLDQFEVQNKLKFRLEKEVNKTILKKLLQSIKRD